jgi:membrane protein
MNALKAKLEAFQRSKVGQFVKKVQDDQVPNLASLLAWGTLSALLPLVLGILALTGLVIRDPERLDQIYNTLLALLPSGANGMLGPALEGIRHQAAAPVGIIGLVLLLYNGASFFSNMATIFDLAYHVEDRNIVLSNVVAILMLILVTALMGVSAAALGIGTAIGNLPLGLPIGPALGRAISWSISIVSTIIMFWLLYKILPNKPQSWRDALPGALLSAALFFGITLLFPLYLKLFPPDQTYAVFGVFLVFTFWLYLLGLVFVLGAELNAFLEEPARSVALAEAMAQAQGGKAQVSQEPGQVQAQATGAAPDTGGRGPPRPRRAASTGQRPAERAAATIGPSSGTQCADGAAAHTGAVKKVLWTGLASGSLALAGLAARRLSSAVWKTIAHEPPPTSKL